MRGRSLFPALALILLLPLFALAQNNTIRGKVRSMNGITLNNAIVELRKSGSGMMGQTVTRNDGDFAFSGLAPAEYEVVVTLAGYEPGIEVVRFTQSPRDTFYEVRTVEVLLRPKAEPVLGPPGVNFVQDVPKAARGAYEKAVSKFREGKSEEGITLLREAISIFNNYFNAHFQLGAELYRLNKLDEALESLERARQINEREPAVYHMFGLVMIKQQKFTVAEYAFREATKLNSSNPASHFYRALALIELAFHGNDEQQVKTDFADAEKELNQAWELSDKKLTGVYIQRARIHERRGNKEAAARELETYLKAEPEAKNASTIREAITRLRNGKQ